MTDKKSIKTDVSILESLHKKYPGRTFVVDDEYDLDDAQQLSPESGARYATAEEIANLKKTLFAFGLPEEYAATQDNAKLKKMLSDFNLPEEE